MLRGLSALELTEWEALAIEERREQAAEEARRQQQKWRGLG